MSNSHYFAILNNELYETTFETLQLSMGGGPDFSEVEHLKL